MPLCVPLGVAGIFSLLRDMAHWEERDAFVPQMQSDNTDNMMFPVAEMLVYITQGVTLEPGDIIFTGTPSGVGHARKPNPIWMKQGDLCEIEIEEIGVLRNPIEDEK